MPRTLPRSLFVGACLLLSISYRALADGPSKDELKKKYRGLIEQLASPNEEPVTRNRAYGTVKFPPGYDVKAQNRISDVRKILQNNIEEALPYLIKAQDDDRYCMTIDWAEGDAYYNYSVGSICENIIASQLEVYREKIGFDSPQHWNRYNYGPYTKEWRKKRKGDSLAELQVEAIDWAIEKRKDELKSIIEPRRKNEISDLEKLRDGISKSGKPAKPKPMFRMVTSDQGRR